MIAVDSNLLVYAHREEMPQCEDARRALRGLVEGPGSWAIPWPCVHEFLGVATNARIFRPATPSSVALAAIESLVAEGNLLLLAEAADHGERLRHLVVRGRVAGPAIHDARIAAICLSHGVREIWTADRDFGRFPDLRVRNPLVHGQ